MMNNSNKTEPAVDVKELMKVVETGYLMGVNFHIYKRKRIPSWIEFGTVTNEGWMVLAYDHDCETE